MYEIPYEGKETNLKEEPYCLNCGKKPASGLLICSRCRVAWYCSSACQKQDYTCEHKMLCRRIAQNMERMKEEAALLRKRAPDRFETEVGNFGLSRETRGYLKALSDLANCYWRAAFNGEIKSVWEKALFHSFEVMRLDGLDTLEARFNIPFILLCLNRDDEAFAFMRHWMRYFEVPRRQQIMLRQTFANKEGEWPYPREANCRYLDFFEECRHIDDREMPLSFLVALFIIKTRIVAAHYATRRSLELAFETTGGQLIQEVRAVVTEMLIDSNVVIASDVDVHSQRHQVSRLFYVINRNNPTMLPSILNPDHLLDLEPPVRRFVGDPSEVFDVLHYCDRSVLRVPGNQDILENEFGENPIYDTTMHPLARVPF